MGRSVFFKKVRSPPSVFSFLASFFSPPFWNLEVCCILNVKSIGGRLLRDPPSLQFQREKKRLSQGHTHSPRRRALIGSSSFTLRDDSPQWTFLWLRAQKPAENSTFWRSKNHRMVGSCEEKEFGFTYLLKKKNKNQREEDLTDQTWRKGVFSSNVKTREVLTELRLEFLQLLFEKRLKINPSSPTFRKIHAK